MKNKYPLTDAEILNKSRLSPWMFGLLVDRYQKAFMRKSLGILRSSELAEDAVQETFLKIYKYSHKFAEQDDAKFSSWAYKILTNTCYSMLERKNKKESSVMNMDFADLDILGSNGVSYETDRASLVRSVLSKIPEKLSRIIKLYFFEDRSYKEIAEMENITLPTVRSRLYRAKKNFKEIAIKII